MTVHASCDVNRISVLIALRQLADRHDVLTATPLGIPVEPEV